MASMSEPLPGREVEDIPDSDEIFHTIYNLEQRYRVPGAQCSNRGKSMRRGWIRIPMARRRIFVRG